MKLQIWILAVIALFSCSIIHAESADTLRKNVTWPLKKSPFYIYSGVIVDTNTTLTIEPGSMVIFASYDSKLEVRGSLIAKGVDFTSHYASRNEHGDSIYFYDQYYSPAEYYTAKKAYELINFETYFMPGLSYSFYKPKLSDSIGNFSGITVEYLIFGKVGQNDHPGPSHVRVYSKLSILQSTESNVKSMFMYAVGLDLSLEKNPKRSYLVPYFGLELGGMSQKKFGSCMTFTPTFGVHILSQRNIFINLHGGYVYPMQNYESLQGWYAQAGVNFAMW